MLWLNPKAKILKKVNRLNRSIEKTEALIHRLHQFKRDEKKKRDRLIKDFQLL